MIKRSKYQCFPMSIFNLNIVQSALIFTVLTRMDHEDYKNNNIIF